MSKDSSEDIGGIGTLLDDIRHQSIPRDQDHDFAYLHGPLL